MLFEYPWKRNKILIDFSPICRDYSSMISFITNVMRWTRQIPWMANRMCVGIWMEIRTKWNKSNSFVHLHYWQRLCPLRLCEKQFSSMFPPLLVTVYRNQWMKINAKTKFEQIRSTNLTIVFYFAYMKLKNEKYLWFVRRRLLWLLICSVHLTLNTTVTGTKCVTCDGLKLVAHHRRRRKKTSEFYQTEWRIGYNTHALHMNECMHSLFCLVFVG